MHDNIINLNDPWTHDRSVPVIPSNEQLQFFDSHAFY